MKIIITERIAQDGVDYLLNQGFEVDCKFGIQRDDIEIIINGKNARQFASQGQIRSIVLALKMAEGEIIKEDFSEYPVYLLDDVLSELDERRREYV